MESQNIEETATSPSAETPKEEVKVATEAVEKNGAAEESSTTVEPATEVKAEEPAKKTEEAEPKLEEPKSAPVDEPKVSEPVCEKPAESAPSPVKDDVPQVETPKVVEESITAESKEVISNDACEVRQDFGDIVTESNVTSAESTTVATVEE